MFSTIPKAYLKPYFGGFDRLEAFLTYTSNKLSFELIYDFLSQTDLLTSITSALLDKMLDIGFKCINEGQRITWINPNN